jgi:transposase-like protein
MKERREYTQSFRQQALEKVYTRGSNSIRVVAEDLNIVRL